MSVTAKKMKNGTWHIQYRWVDWTGKARKSDKNGFKTKREAEDWVRHFLIEQSSDPSMTLSEFYHIYTQDMSKRLRVTTMSNKDYIMQDKILPYFGKTAINEITPAKIRQWQGVMLSKGFKPTYLKTVNNQLSCIMNYAVRFYHLRSNPCHAAGSMGKNHADERPYWTIDEFNLFLQAVDDKRDSWVAFQILFYSGIRIGECLAVKVNDFNFEAHTMRIDESLARLKGKTYVTPPKTESSIRTVVIHQELCDIVSEYISTLYKPKPDRRLFEDKTKSYFEHEFRRGIKATGLPEITIHCLRHSHASMLIQQGFNPQEIAKRLGHAKVTTTIETYCHASRDAQERIAVRMEEIAKGG